MTASGSGAPGTVKADVTVRLEERDGGTVLTYDADASWAEWSAVWVSE